MKNELVLIIDNLFRSLAGIFPAAKSTWSTMEELNSAKREWIIAFKDNGIVHTEQIKRGLTECRKMDTPFPPSIGTFLANCRRDMKDIGMPSFSDGWYVIKNLQPYEVNSLHPALHEALHVIGFNAVKSGGENEMRSRFEKAYSVIVETWRNDDLKDIGLKAISQIQEEPSHD